LPIAAIPADKSADVTFWNADSYGPETLPAMARQYGCDVDFERTMPLVEQHGLIF
jgi:hypothetical protein